jgi:hypothetical protein
MFTRNESDRFQARVLASVVIAVTLVVSAMAHAVATSQAFV